MSWFFGGAGKFDESELRAASSVASGRLVEIEERDFFLYAGGNKNTCIQNLESKGSDSLNWLAVGLGISNSAPQKFMDRDYWSRIIENNAYENLDGHFVILTWNTKQIQIITDKIGLRDFYYATDAKGNILFSTRADWLAKFVNTEINFREFGSRWLLHNQISPNSILKKIKRVVQGDEIQIDLRSKTVTEIKNNWLPEIEGPEFNPAGFVDSLTQLSTFPFTNQKLSLSLSGGMDSRVIFSILANRKGINWNAHSFGTPSHPDNLIARKICEDNGIEHVNIDLPVPSPEKFIDELKDYTSRTLVNNSASLFFQQRNYNWFNGREEVLIDGGYGEIWRRQFNFLLALKGRNAIITRNPSAIIPLIKFYRGSFFSEEINNFMYKGAEEQISNLFSLLPSPEKIGIGNWLELYSIKTRLPNCYLHEQARIDELTSCYTPFVQPSLLKNVLLLNFSFKKNGRLFRKIIEENLCTLKSFDLVKGNVRHPFNLTAVQARLWSLISTKLRRKKNVKPVGGHLIFSVKELLIDMLSSKNMMESGIYDRKKIEIVKQALIKNELNPVHLHELDWWLSFELFRRQIYHK